MASRPARSGYHLHQRSRWPIGSAREGCLELQDALTTSLQGADLAFDPGEGLDQVFRQESSPFRKDE
jgi:hypothetical protein